MRGRITLSDTQTPPSSPAHDGSEPASGGMRAKLRRKLSGQGGDSAFTALSFLATAALGFVNLPILAWGLGSEGRGELAAVVAITQLLGFMTRFGMPRAAAYFAMEIPWRRLIMAAWVTTLVASVPVLVALFPLYDWFLADNSPIAVDWFYAFLALTVITGPASSAIFWLRGRGETARFNLYQALPAVLTSLGYVGLWVADRLTGSDVFTLGNALLSTFVANAVAWTLVLVRTNGLPGRGFDRTHFTTQANYGLRAWFGSLSYLVTFRIDQVFLAGLVSNAELGRYAVAATGATLSLPISRGIAQTLLPHVRRATTHEERVARTRRAIRWSALASAVTLVAIGLLAWVAIPHVLPADFAGTLTPLLLLLPGQWANDVATVHSSALDSFNRPGVASTAQIVSAVVTIGGLAVFAPLYGIEGAAVVTSVAYLAYLVVVRFGYSRAVAAGT